MADFAQIDQFNTVINVVVVNDADCTDAVGNISESVGAAYLSTHIPGPYTFLLRTDRGVPHRNSCGIGWIWRPEINAFQSPQPYPSWTFNTSTLSWDAPVPMPTDNQKYRWDEDSKQWVVVP